MLIDADHALGSAPFRITLERVRIVGISQLGLCFPTWQRALFDRGEPSRMNRPSVATPKSPRPKQDSRFGNCRVPMANGSSGTAQCAIEPGASRFDADAWSALIEEQRIRIARAAGAQLSQVTIQIGH